MRTGTRLVLDRRRMATAAGALALLASTHAGAQTTVVNEDFKVTSSDAAAGDSFGLSASIDGDAAIIGASRDDDAGADSGSAYVFRFDGLAWGQEAKLSASDAAAGDQFGHSVSISGNTAVVGAYLDDDAGADSGAAYVFHFDGSSWSQAAKLVAADAAAGDRFGWSVSASGNAVIVGANNDDDAGSSSGSAYVFRFDGVSWAQEAKLTASDAASADIFGESVSISGDAAVVGALGDDDDGLFSGSAYVFRFDGSSWAQEAKLTASDAGAFDQFGVAVGISGDAAIVGSLLDDDGGSDAGAAYVFRFDGSSWAQEAKLIASDAASSDRFGAAVSICGSVAAVGAEFDDDAGTNSGSAYIFRYDGSAWAEDVKLVASDGALGDVAGVAVAACQTAVIGASGDDDNGSGSGSAYFYSLVSDSDGDGLSDADETGIYGTNPLLADTDGDGLDDGDEIALQAFAGCPDPTLFDSDGDGLGDGFELTFFPALDPCDADADADGLADGAELSAGSDPFNPDTDGDGLLDGTEYDLALASGSGCPDLLVADSDGDTLSDGDEVTLGTSPCNADTDGDGADDAIDPTPTDPGTSSGFVEDWVRMLSDEVSMFDLDLIRAPNNNAARARRNAMRIKLCWAATRIAWCHPQGAINSLERLLDRLDGEPGPRDWMEPSPERDQLVADIELAIAWLEYELP